MFVPLLAVPLAVQLIAATEGVPKLDVTASCRGAAEAGYATTTQERLQNCIDSEHRTRDQLGKDWSSFPASLPDVLPLVDCHDFAPTYTELATCLEMRRDLANPKPPEAGATGMAPPRRR